MPITLFSKLWPKLLEACATETLGELGDMKAKSRLGKKDAAGWMDSMEAASARDESVDDQIAVKVKEMKNAVSFQSYGKNQPEQHLHRSIIKK